MKYDFNKKAIDLKGEESDTQLATVLSELIGTETNGDLCYWYNELLKNKSLDLHEAERKILHDLVKNTDRLQVFIKVQLLEVLKP